MAVTPRGLKETSRVLHAIARIPLLAGSLLVGSLLAGNLVAGTPLDGMGLAPATFAMSDVARAGEGGLSLEALEKPARWPSWAKAKRFRLNPNKPWQAFANARASTRHVREAVGRFRYMVEEQSKAREYPWALLNLGRLLADCDEDVLAYQTYTTLIELPANTPHNGNLYKLPNLAAVQHEGRLGRARILAKHGHGEAARAELAAAPARDGYDWVRHAEALTLLDAKDEAKAALRRATGGGHPEGNFSDVFLRMRATVLARVLDDAELARGIAQPFTRSKQDAQKWPQWQSSWAIGTGALEGLGTPARLTGLKDGRYTGECRGFVGPIKVRVTVRQGAVATVDVVSSKDDRPWTALEVVPERIVARQSLNVDAVTHATVSSCAILVAVDQALAKAR